MPCVFETAILLSRLGDRFVLRRKHQRHTLLRVACLGIVRNVKRACLASPSAPIKYESRDGEGLLHLVCLLAPPLGKRRELSSCICARVRMPATTSCSSNTRALTFSKNSVLPGATTQLHRPMQKTKVMLDSLGRAFCLHVPFNKIVDVSLLFCTASYCPVVVLCSGKAPSSR